MILLDERASNARAGWLGETSYTSDKATQPRGPRKDAGLGRWGQNCAPWA